MVIAATLWDCERKSRIYYLPKLSILSFKHWYIHSSFHATFTVCQALAKLWGHKTSKTQSVSSWYVVQSSRHSMLLKYCHRRECPSWLKVVEEPKRFFQRGIIQRFMNSQALSILCGFLVRKQFPGQDFPIYSVSFPLVGKTKKDTVLPSFAPQRVCEYLSSASPDPLSTPVSLALCPRKLISVNHLYLTLAHWLPVPFGQY